MLNNIIFFLVTILFLQCSVSTKNGNVETFLPLQKGSYWIYQDSVFNNQTDEVIQSKTLIKDSVLNVTKSDSNIIIDLANFLKLDSTKWDEPTFIQYKIFPNGEIYDRVLQVNKGWSDWSPKGYNIYPKEGDTKDIAGLQFTYKKCTLFQGYESFCLKANDNSENIVFVNGIGKVGRALEDDSWNLIEYRIGNGIKNTKHWLIPKVQ